jgi:hypothetical protein
VIVIERVESLDDLDPLVRGEALALIGGGILDLHRASAPKRVETPPSEVK